MPTKTKSKKVKNQDPVMPKELWMLWVTHDTGEECAGHWLPAFDDPGTLCHETEAEAIQSAKHQEDLYCITTKPVRVI